MQKAAAIVWFYCSSLCVLQFGGYLQFVMKEFYCGCMVKHKKNMTHPPKNKCIITAMTVHVTFLDEY